jgi:hypothetical protein
VSADAAALFDIFPVVLLRSTFEAAVPAFLPVTSLLDFFDPDLLAEAADVEDTRPPPDDVERDFTDVGGRLGMIC